MKFNRQFFNASHEEDFHFLALEQELLIMALGPISPVFFEKNHNFSQEQVLRRMFAYIFARKAKTVPTVECPDASFGDRLFQIWKGQLKRKSQPHGERC